MKDRRNNLRKLIKKKSQRKNMKKQKEKKEPKPSNGRQKLMNKENDKLKKI